jgi:hypothetical protein
MIAPKYPSTQGQLYTISKAAWQACNLRLPEFSSLKPKYDAAFVTGKVSAVTTAEDLPDDEQRKQTAKLLRDQMIVKAEECRDFWQRLKLYIEEAFPENELDTQLSAAGYGHYPTASKDNWDAVKRLMIDGNQFITDNTAALEANDNMPPGPPPAGFAVQFATAKSEFEILYNSYINATLDTEVKTQGKVAANNAVYKDLTSMLKDGQRIFKNDDAVKKLFTFEQLLNDVAGPGIAGLRGLLRDSVTNLPLLEGVFAHIKIFGTDHETDSGDDSRYKIEAVAAGTYTIVITCPGYQELQIPNIEIETGTMKTLNITLVPLP